MFCMYTYKEGSKNQKSLEKPRKISLDTQNWSEDVFLIDKSNSGNRMKKSIFPKNLMQNFEIFTINSVISHF